jgi:hypothetical protein
VSPPLADSAFRNSSLVLASKADSLIYFSRQRMVRFRGPRHNEFARTAGCAADFKQLAIISNGKIAHAFLGCRAFY